MAYVTMRSRRIGSQIPTLGGQLGLRKLLTDAYKDATSQPYGYLVADFSNRSDQEGDKVAIRSNIFPEEPEPVVIYTE
jgi:hypothetical protein